MATTAPAMVTPTPRTYHIHSRGLLSFDAANLTRLNPNLVKIDENTLAVIGGTAFAGNTKGPVDTPFQKREMVKTTYETTTGTGATKMVTRTTTKVGSGICTYDLSSREIGSTEVDETVDLGSGATVFSVQNPTTNKYEVFCLGGVNVNTRPFQLILNQTKLTYKTLWSLIHPLYNGSFMNFGLIDQTRTLIFYGGQQQQDAGIDNGAVNPTSHIDFIDLSGDPCNLDRVGLTRHSRRNVLVRKPSDMPKELYGGKILAVDTGHLVIVGAYEHFEQKIVDTFYELNWMEALGGYMLTRHKVGPYPHGTSFTVIKLFSDDIPGVILVLTRGLNAGDYGCKVKEISYGAVQGVLSFTETSIHVKSTKSINGDVTEVDPGTRAASAVAYHNGVAVIVGGARGTAYEGGAGTLMLAATTKNQHVNHAVQMRRPHYFSLLSLNPKLVGRNFNPDVQLIDNSTDPTQAQLTMAAYKEKAKTWNVTQLRQELERKGYGRCMSLKNKRDLRVFLFLQIDNGGSTTSDSMTSGSTTSGSTTSGSTTSGSSTSGSSTSGSMTSGSTTSDSSKTSGSKSRRRREKFVETNVVHKMSEPLTNNKTIKWNENKVGDKATLFCVKRGGIGDGYLYAVVSNSSTQKRKKESDNFSFMKKAKIYYGKNPRDIDSKILDTW